jgi:amino acid adenylation domain-containing protein
MISMGDRAPEYLTPASEIQKMFWLTNQIQPHNPAYNIASIFNIKGNITINTLYKSINQVCKSHSVLLAGFKNSDNELMQFINDQIDIPLPVINLTQMHENQKEKDIKRLLEEEVNRPFDLSSPPLVRALLIKLSDLEHIFSIVIHHIIFDLESKDIFARDLADTYLSLSENYPAPSIKIKQYAEYSLKQKSIIDNNGYSEMARYWKNSLSGQSGILNLPADFPRSHTITVAGNRHYFTVDRDLVKILRRRSRELGVNLFATMLAVYYILLHRLSHQVDITVGIPFTNRRDDDYKGVIGCFVNILPISMLINGTESFDALIKSVRTAMLGAHRNQEIPFSLIVKESGIKRNPAYNPVYQAGFTFEHPMNLEIPGLEIRNIFTTRYGVQLDIFMTLWESGDELSGYLEYNTGLFSDETASRMVRSYLKLAESAINNSTAEIDSLRMLSPEDEELIIRKWNNTRRDYDLSIPLHRHFEMQAEKTPERLAVKFREQSITYRELNERSNVLARELASRGLKQDTLAGVYMERSVEMVIALYAILKAGGAYLPLNPELPEARIKFITDDAEPVLIITQEHLKNRLSGCASPIITADSSMFLQGVSMKGNPDVNVSCDNLAYCIYTSGSTGKPKGALISHKSICNRLLWMQEYFNIDKNDRVLQKTPFDFDVSVWEFFWPLIAGAALVMAEPGGHMDSAYLIHTISSEQITVIHFVPAMLEIFLRDPEIHACKTLRYVICSGEALPYTLQEKFFSTFSCGLFNLYGPTEAAVDVTYWKCSMDYGRNTVPIGYPVANTQMYILNSALIPVPPGVEGDLYIGGVQLSRGYLNREGLTSERFIPDPFSSAENARIYKTGDIARWLTDGAIEYIGRSDFQIKFNGVRIETGEIEYAMCQHPGISGAVVTLYGEGENKKIAAYYTPKPDVACTPVELRNTLKGILLLR